MFGENLTKLRKQKGFSQEQNEMEVLASELAKLNELLVVYGNKASNLKKKIGTAIGVVILILIVCAVYDSWKDMWYEFGQNLYYLLNP